MKVKVSLSSDDGQEWTAEAKDLGLVTIGASMLSALENMQIEIRNFFTDAFGSSKQVEVICSKIKAIANVTVAPLDPRPETPLTEYMEAEVPEEDSMLETDEPLLLESGEITIQAEVVGE